VSATSPFPNHEGFEDAPEPNPSRKSNGHGTTAFLTPAAWAAREIAPQDFLLGELLFTTSRTLFAADTGLGKTMVSLAMALAMSQGRDFLHWGSARPARVLYLDGEMPAELLKQRIVERRTCRPSG
jgi:RecA-family ATPase